MRVDETDRTKPLTPSLAIRILSLPKTFSPTFAGRCQRVGRIAADLGFDRDRYFTRDFKKIYGMAPTEYREFHQRRGTEFVMTFIKIIVGLPLLLMVFFLSFLFDGRARTVSDFKVEQVRYSKAYIDTYGVSRRYRKIAIISEEKKYSLYPDEPFLPEGMTLDSVAELLNRSSEAIIWTEKNRYPESVRGIQTDYLNIPPSRGIHFLNNDRKMGWLWAVVCFASSIFAYFYFKRYFGLDWKLNFRIGS
jgi:Bacterial regulatory helix-turn-helix proteins, AraC family